MSSIICFSLSGEKSLQRSVLKQDSNEIMSRIYHNIGCVHAKRGAHKEAMFYFDLETSVYSKQFAQLMRELEYMCEGFQYLGSYTEII